MSKYTIGQVSQLLGIKVHTIRYWEKNIPLISTQRDETGKRIYGRQDIFILSQLHYLIGKRKFTLQGASDELLAVLGTKEKQVQKEVYFEVLKTFDQQRDCWQKVNSLVSQIRTDNSLQIQEHAEEVQDNV